MGRVPAVHPAALLRNQREIVGVVCDINDTGLNSTEADQTFVKAVLVHRPVNVEVLPCHQREFCLRMLIRPVIRIVTTTKNTNLYFLMSNTAILQYICQGKSIY